MDVVSRHQLATFCLHVGSLLGVSWWQNIFSVSMLATLFLTASFASRGVFTLPKSMNVLLIVIAGLHTLGMIGFLIAISSSDSASHTFSEDKSLFQLLGWTSSTVVAVFKCVFAVCMTILAVCAYVFKGSQDEDDDTHVSPQASQPSRQKNMSRMLILANASLTVSIAITFPSVLTVPFIVYFVLFCASFGEETESYAVIRFGTSILHVYTPILILLYAVTQMDFMGEYRPKYPNPWGLLKPDVKDPSSPNLRFYFHLGFLVALYYLSTVLERARWLHEAGGTANGSDWSARFPRVFGWIRSTFRWTFHYSPGLLVALYMVDSMLDPSASTVLCMALAFSVTMISLRDFLVVVIPVLIVIKSITTLIAFVVNIPGVTDATGSIFEDIVGNSHVNEPTIVLFVRCSTLALLIMCRRLAVFHSKHRNSLGSNLLMPNHPIQNHRDSPRSQSSSDTAFRNDRTHEETLDDEQLRERLKASFGHLVRTGNGAVDSTVITRVYGREEAEGILQELPANTGSFTVDDFVTAARRSHSLTELHYRKLGFTALLGHSLWELLLNNTEVFVLVFLFIGGTFISDADILHSVFVLFFVIFLIFRKLAFRIWNSVIMYCFLFIMSQFVFNLLFPHGTHGPTPRVTYNVIGLLQWDSPWEMGPFFVLLVFLVGQRYVYTFRNARKKPFWFRVSLEHAVTVRARQRLVYIVVLTVTAACFACVGLFEPVSMIAFPYLAFFIVGGVILAYSRNSQTHLSRLALFGAMYSVPVLILINIYQYQVVQSAVEDRLQERDYCHNATVSCATELGLISYRGQPNTVPLIPWFLAAILCYVLRRSATNVLSSIAAVHEVNADPSHQTFASEQTDWNMEKLQQYFLVKLTSIAEVFLRVIMVHGMKLWQISLVLAAVSFPSVIHSVYILLLLLNSTKMSLSYAIVHLCGQYFYLFTFVGKVDEYFEQNNFRVPVGLWKLDTRNEAPHLFPSFAVIITSLLVEAIPSIVKHEGGIARKVSSYNNTGIMFLAYLLDSLFAYYCFDMTVLVYFLVAVTQVHNLIGAVGLLMLVLVGIGGRDGTKIQNWRGRLSFILAAVNLIATYLFFMLEFKDSWDQSAWGNFVGANPQRIEVILIFFPYFFLFHLFFTTKERGTVLLEEEHPPLPPLISIVTTRWENIKALLRKEQSPEEGRLEFLQIIPIVPDRLYLYKARTTKELWNALLYRKSVFAVLFIMIVQAVASDLDVLRLLRAAVAFYFIDVGKFGRVRRWSTIVMGLHVTELIVLLISSIPPVADFFMNYPNFGEVLGVITHNHKTMSVDFSWYLVICLSYMQYCIFNSPRYSEVLLRSYESSLKNKQRGSLLAQYVQAHEKEAVLTLNREREERQRMLGILKQKNQVIGEGVSGESTQPTKEEDPVTPVAVAATPALQEIQLDSSRLDASIKLMSEWFARRNQQEPGEGEEASESPLVDPHPQTPFGRKQYVFELWMNFYVWIGSTGETWIAVVCIFWVIVAPSAYEMLMFAVMYTYGLVVYPWGGKTYWKGVQLYMYLGLSLKCIHYIFTIHEEAVPTAYDVLFGRLTPIDFLLCLMVQAHIHTATSRGYFSVQWSVEDKELDKAAIHHGTLEHIKRFFHTTKNSMAGGRDLYTAYFTCDVMCFVFFVPGYYSLVGNATGSLVESVNENLLPGPLVAVLMALVTVWVVDRLLYLTCNNLGKYIFQVISTAGYLATYSTWFSNQAVPPTFPVVAGTIFIWKCIYLLISAEQLRYGFKRNPVHDVFTRRADGMWYIPYNIYRAIPFFWEMRNFLDWSATPTSLKFNYWLSVEDIYHEVYLRKTDLQDTKVTNPKFGQQYPLKWKLCGGSLIFVVLMLVLFFPLFYFSTFNPSMKVNDMTDVYTTISFEGTSPFYASRVLGQNLHPLSHDDMQKLANYRPTMKNYDVGSSYKSAQMVNLPNCSGDVWTMSPPSRDELVNALQRGNARNIITATTFTRTAGLDGSNIVTLVETWPMDTTFQKLVIRLMNESDTAVTSIVMSKFYSPIILNQPASVRTLPEADTLGVNRQDCNATVLRQVDPDSHQSVRYWCVRCNSLFPTTNSIPNSPSCDPNKCKNYEYSSSGFKQVPLYYVISSDDVPSSTVLANLGIIALYTTFILALGRVIRGSLTGGAHRVVLQNVADVKPLEDIMQGIFLSRQLEDYVQEMEWYFELIDVLRDPSRLFRMTGSSQQQYDADGMFRVKME